MIIKSKRVSNSSNIIQKKRSVIVLTLNCNPCATGNALLNVTLYKFLRRFVRNPDFWMHNHRNVMTFHIFYTSFMVSDVCRIVVAAARVQLWLFIFLIISIFRNQPKIFSKQFNSIVGCVHVKYFNSFWSQIRMSTFLRMKNNFMDWNSLPTERFFNNRNCIIMCGNWFRKNVHKNNK